MSLTALTPQFGTEMEDSAMQEDHVADSSIAIDVESPKHIVITPQGANYGDSTTSASFWSHSQPQGTADQLVDVEFETAGAYEDDGMMAATEVEMTAAGPYEEDNELEMAYDNGQPEFNYEVEDAEVRDAEVSYQEHSHEPASHFGHLEHEQPQESLVVSAPEIDTFGASDPLPFAEVATNPEFSHEEETAIIAPSTEEVAQDSLETTAPAPAGDDHPAEPALVAEAAAEEITEGANEEAGDEQPLEIPAEEKEQPQEPEIKVSEDFAPIADHEVPEEVYDAETHEEAKIETNHLGTAPPILLTVNSEGLEPVTVSLFSDPDAAIVASSSKTVSEPPVVLLDQHHHLFGEPLTDLLTQLRTELLHAQPEILPRSDFEYKEVQLVVHDLQLVLTQDNIYAREISLFDLESMHRSCGLSGYLHLDFSMQPRFIDRYRAIRQAIEAQGIINNPEITTQDEAKETEEIENTAVAKQENTSPQVEVTGATLEQVHEDAQSQSNLEDNEAHGPVEEDGETGEPPLPLDDGASSWSEEQEDDGVATGDYQAEEEGAHEGWDHAHEGEPDAPVEAPAEEVPEEEYNEEYLHEDDYLPGDLVHLEDDADFTGDAGEEAGTSKPFSNNLDESKTGDDAYNDEATEPTIEATIELPEETPAHADDTTEPVGESGDNTGDLAAEEAVEYVDNESEWDDLGYATGLEAIKENPSLEEPSVPQNETKPSPKRRTSSGLWTGAHDTLSPPQRKRSFSEVEAEPEGNLSLSPGPKKPRHL